MLTTITVDIRSNHFHIWEVEYEVKERTGARGRPGWLKCTRMFLSFDDARAYHETHEALPNIYRNSTCKCRMVQVKG